MLFSSGLIGVLRQKIWYILAWILLLPALLINIDLNPLLADEPIRALVALEMYLNNNLWTPSMNGEFYYNKPPLFNWIILALFRSFNSFEEWVIRIPTVASLFIYGVSIYFIFRKYLNGRMAFIIAFATLTSGRILLYDSFLGLIDCFFSLVIFLLFMSVYHFSTRREWLIMYLSTYFLAAIAFMLKGLPAPVFTGFTLLGVLISQKKWKMLFSWQHLVGGAVFLILIGSYYFFYQKYNSLDQVFTTLWSESTKRTVAETSILKSIGHIVKFPFDFLFNFLPFSALIVFCLHKKSIKELRSHGFLKACVLIFLVNIWVYWLSPETRPRYLFMFLPLFFAWPVYMMHKAEEDGSFWVGILNKVFMLLCIILALASWLPIFIFPAQLQDGYLVVKCLLFFVAMSMLAFMIYRYSKYGTVIFIVAMLVLRIGFDLFVFPHRQLTLEEVTFKKYALDVASMTGNEKVYFRSGVPIGPTGSFYMSKQKGDIIRRIDTLPAKGDYIIIYPGTLESSKRKYSKVMDMHVRYQNTLLHLVRMED